MQATRQLRVAGQANVRWTPPSRRERKNMSINKDPFNSLNKFNDSMNKLTSILNSQSSFLDKVFIQPKQISKLDSVLKELSALPAISMSDQYKHWFTQMNTLNAYYPSLYINRTKNNNSYNISETIESDSSITLTEIPDVLVLNKIVEGISFAECRDFISYISDFPMLGFKHEIGKKIYSFISKCTKHSMLENVIVYRVRMASERKQIGYMKNEMFEPQYGYPSQNRFSMIGINPLYISENLEIAKLETGIEAKSKYTWIELEIINNFIILDITNNEIPLFSQCHRVPESDTKSMKIEYLISNFVADCAKECEFEGIKYKSVYNQNINNYVLFHQSQRDFKVKQIISENFT